MDERIYYDINQIEEEHWWYKARRKIIYYWAITRSKEPIESKILDIGCGTGFNLKNLSKNGYSNTIGLDISLLALNFANKKGVNPLVAGNSNHLPFTDSIFDLLLALDMLEHVENDNLTLEEIFRITKTDGKVVFFVPAIPLLWGYQDEVGHHFRRYTRKNLSKKVNKAGFKIQKISYVNSFLFPIIFFARMFFKLFPKSMNKVSESQLSPSWMNNILYKIFLSELFLLKHINFPLGVSILCVCNKV